jgi:hypothetical protein
MGAIINYPKFKAQDSAGVPLIGGLLYTYVTGTTTPKATYSDAGLSVQNANPVVLDSNGEAPIFGSGTYKLVLQDSDGVTLWTFDGVACAGAAAIMVSATDQSPDYLLSKLVAGANISLTQQSVGGDETIMITAVGLPSAVATGTSDAILANFVPDLTLADGLLVAVRCSAANTTTTPTPDALPARVITKLGGQAMIAGNIPRAGFVALLQYDLTNTRWELLNPVEPTGIPARTTNGANMALAAMCR